IVIQVLRGEETKEFTVHTDLDKSTGIGRIGILVDPSSRKLREAKTYSFFPAVWHGIGDTFSTISMTFKGISMLFKGVDITNAVSGPVRITTFLGETVEEGFSEGFREGLAAVLKFASVINVSLFIMNLLPIPVLDGGLILFALIETITRKRISPKVQNRVQYIGIAFIACLMVFAISGDIKYFWSSR
ncbi:MAG: site-2 protease family protein, partial [Treponema sp.]|nr:site-2 protease family protein [Treponema sp.]